MPFLSSPLLHQSTKANVGVALANENQESLLPMISSNICGTNKMYKRGNVLFESGAQISLIKEETAESLGLKGKDVSITITKVGGEEEKVKSKAYRVPVTSFGLTLCQIHRGKGSIDLLIGIDHAFMHTGETRQTRCLVARNSSLGWVVFGSTPGERNRVNKIFCVSFSSP
jgi:hypothetical protein